MRLLLDTHVLLWALSGDRRIGKARALILDQANSVAISTASYLELAIKTSLGKIAVDLPQIREAVMASGFDELPITGAHTELGATAVAPQYPSADPGGPGACEPMRL